MARKTFAQRQWEAQQYRNAMEADIARRHAEDVAKGRGDRSNAVRAWSIGIIVGVVVFIASMIGMGSSDTPEASTTTAPSVSNSVQREALISQRDELVAKCSDLRQWVQVAEQLPYDAQIQQQIADAKPVLADCAAQTESINSQIAGLS